MNILKHVKKSCLIAGVVVLGLGGFGVIQNQSAHATTLNPSTISIADTETDAAAGYDISQFVKINDGHTYLGAPVPSQAISYNMNDWWHNYWATGWSIQNNSFVIGYINNDTDLPALKAMITKQINLQVHSLTDVVCWDWSGLNVLHGRNYGSGVSVMLNVRGTFIYQPLTIFIATSGNVKTPTLADKTPDVEPNPPVSHNYVGALTATNDLSYMDGRNIGKQTKYKNEAIEFFTEYQGSVDDQEPSDAGVPFDKGDSEYPVAVSSATATFRGELWFDLREEAGLQQLSQENSNDEYLNEIKINGYARSDEGAAVAYGLRGRTNSVDVEGDIVHISSKGLVIPLDAKYLEVTFPAEVTGFDRDVTVHVPVTYTNNESDFTYEFNDVDGTAILTAYDYVNGGKNVDIPAMAVDDYGYKYVVTEIGTRAISYGNAHVDFNGEMIGISRIESLKLPDTIQKIGAYAFASNKFTKENSSIILPDSLTYIGEGAFFDCYVEDVNFPDKLETIEAYAFMRTYINGSLYFPDSVKFIGYESFYGDHMNIPELSIAYDCDIDKYEVAVNLGSKSQVTRRPQIAE
ncbi:MAG: leucine-rich repeat domain-containing protein [Lactobacillaceae bacterium]|jgi:hypothetical protein|nr:leucine-rich repeat domain-containing protein [Lactobacillaceae bacterium]